jgi:hypothetical protein
MNKHGSKVAPIKGYSVMNILLELLLNFATPVIYYLYIHLHRKIWQSIRKNGRFLVKLASLKN